MNDLFKVVKYNTEIIFAVIKPNPLDMQLKKVIPAILAVIIIFSHDLPAQKVSGRLKVTTSKRPTQLHITNVQLNAFCKNIQIDNINFGKLKVVIVEKTYYLISEEKNSNGIWAFELGQKGKKLILNKDLPIQSCSEGKLSLSSYLQKDGKIIGCKFGDHNREN